MDTGTLAIATRLNIRGGNDMKQMLVIGTILLIFLFGCDCSKQDAVEQKANPKDFNGITLGPSSIVNNIDFGCGQISKEGTILEVNGKILKIEEKDTIEVFCKDKNTIELLINGKSVKL